MPISNSGVPTFFNHTFSRNEDDSDDSDDDDCDDGVDNELLDSDEDELDDEGQQYLESLQVTPVS